VAIIGLVFRAWRIDNPGMPLLVAAAAGRHRQFRKLSVAKDGSFKEEAAAD